MRQSNGCSTSVPKSSVAKQWFEQLPQKRSIFGANRRIGKLGPSPKEIAVANMSDWMKDSTSSPLWRVVTWKHIYASLYVIITKSWKQSPVGWLLEGSQQTNNFQLQLPYSAGFLKLWDTEECLTGHGLILLNWIGFASWMLQSKM